MKAKFFIISILAVILASCEKYNTAVNEKLYLENIPIEDQVLCDMVNLYFDNELVLSASSSQRSKMNLAEKYLETPIDVRAILLYGSDTIRVCHWQNQSFNHYYNYELVIKGVNGNYSFNRVK